MKDDEKALAAAVLAGATPRDAGERLGMNPKRVEYLCEKWATQGWYDYGVSADLGWVNPEKKPPDALFPVSETHRTTEGK